MEKNLRLIANHLRNTGFVTRIITDAVEVSLSRPVSVQEVEEALLKEFDGIEFYFVKTQGKVRVSL